MRQPDWARVVRGINGRLGTRYRLRAQLPGGRQGGAWVVLDPSTGGRHVLTWTTHPGLVARREQTAGLVAALHARGYPTPRWLHWGTLPGGVAFVIADLAPGRPGSWHEVPVRLVLEAVEQQAGLAGPSDDSWSHYLTSALTSGDGPRRDVLSIGSAARPFLDRIDEAAAPLPTVHLPTDDAVHGDLEVGNILVDTSRRADPRISIVDIDACGPGTRAIDYAWLYRDATSHGQTPASGSIREAGRAVAGDEVWSCCLALACLELVAHVARTAGRTGAERAIEQMAAVLHT